MKYLVTGSRGMLGSDRMEALGHGAGLRGYDIEDLDITDPEQCLMRVGEFRPNVVLNAAALTQVDHCESHEEDAFRVNARGAGNLAELASKVGALLVHFSTDYVFDGQKEGPYVEDDPTGPIPPTPQPLFSRTQQTDLPLRPSDGVHGASAPPYPPDRSRPQ